MTTRNIIATCIATFLTGVFVGYSFNNPHNVKPLWINQEIRERVFVACARNAGVDCGEQAKQIATIGNQSGEILFRPKEGGQ
jgi:hypothetical protein